MARDHPPCELAVAVEAGRWRPWPLGFVKGTLHLPESFRPDDPPRDGARASWSRADSSYVEVMGAEALSGLAVAGPVVDFEPACVITVLGRRARVDRIRFVRAAAETTYFTFVGTVVNRGEGLAVAAGMRTRAGRDSLLRAITAIAPGAR